MDINSRFVLNGSIGCYGIWAPGICCPTEHDTKGLSSSGAAARGRDRLSETATTQ